MMGQRERKTARGRPCWLDDEHLVAFSSLWGDVELIIRHDDWCGSIKGGACNCNRDALVIALTDVHN